MDEGATDSTGIGHRIAYLGDANGDGFNDFLVSSKNNEAFVYFGSSEPDTVPDLVITRPDTSTYQFGYYVFSIGDVNDDNKEDFAVFSRRTNAPVGLQCRLYLYFGGAILDDIPDLVIDGDSNSMMTAFGSRCTGIGDFNGDGDNDFLVHDWNFLIDLQQDFRGRAYVYYGGDVLDSIADWQIQGGGEFQRVASGESAGLGDVNSDGFDDFVITDFNCDRPPEQSVGYFAIYHGGADPDTIADVVVWGPGEGGLLGEGVDCADFNRDSLLDVLVVCGHNFSPEHSSSVQVFLSPIDSASQPDLIFPDLDPVNNVFRIVYNIDLNGDGWPDIITGGPNCVISAGKVFVLLGGEDPDTVYDCFYFQGNLDAYLGTGVCNAGDVNGDGIDDLVIGEPGYDEFYEHTNQGRIHVILGDTAFHQSVGVVQKYPPQHAAHFILDAYPNPFNAATVVSFELPVAGKVEVGVYDVFGRNVGARLPRPYTGEWCKPGYHEFRFDAGDLPSGVYIVRLEAGDFRASKKVVLLK
jgi:hypothetical protein